MGIRESSDAGAPVVAARQLVDAPVSLADEVGRNVHPQRKVGIGAQFWINIVLTLLGFGDEVSLSRGLAAGPTFAHGITKTQLNNEWAVSLDVAIEMEAQAQAICMATNDFRRAFEAFAAKKTPEFQGD